MTTRTFPRTLNQAFPFGADYACSIQMPVRACAKITIKTLAATLCLAVGISFFWALV